MASAGACPGPHGLSQACPPRAGQGLNPGARWGPRGEADCPGSLVSAPPLSHRGCTDGRHHRGGRRSWRGLPRLSGNHRGLLLRPLPEKYGGGEPGARGGGQRKRPGLGCPGEQVSGRRRPTSAVSLRGRAGPHVSFRMRSLAPHPGHSGHANDAELDRSGRPPAGPSAGTLDRTHTPLPVLPELGRESLPSEIC